MRTYTRSAAVLAGTVALTTLSACGPYQLTDVERQTAELGARDFADRTQAEYVGCSGQDSEPDGYVSCNVKNRATQSLTKIQCSYKTGSRGCKT